MRNRFIHKILLLLIAIGLFFSHTTSALAGHTQEIFEINDLVFTATPFMASGTVTIENNAKVAVTIESVEVTVLAQKKSGDPKMGANFVVIPSTATFTGPPSHPSLAPGVVIPPKAEITYALEAGYVAFPDSEEIKIQIGVKLEGVPKIFKAEGEEEIVPAPFPPTFIRGTVVSGNPPRPLPGVTVCISPDGSCLIELNVLTPISTTTGPDGSFSLNIPGPELLGQQPLLFDGGTVDPQLGTFASLLNPAFSIVPGSNSAGIIPLIAIDTSRAVSLNEGVQTTSTVIESAPTADGASVVLEIPAGTNVSFAVGATPQISLTQVPLDQLPVPFAPGTFSPLVFTLQPGGTTLDPAAPITFPNPFPGLPDGTIVDIFGLTSQGETGNFTKVGTGVVINGGTQIRSTGGVVSGSWYYPAPQIPPPTTTVDGLVVDTNGNPVVGASVIAMGVSGTTVGPPVDTNDNGQVENFWLSDVPAIEPITVMATLTVGGLTLTGFSAPTLPTFPKTEVGTIVLLPPLNLSPSSLTLFAGSTGTLTVGIPSPALPGGVTVFLVSADPGVVNVPSSVMILEGDTSASFTASGIGPGTTTVTASASGFTNATSTVTVAQVGAPLSLAPSTLNVPQGSTKNLTVGLPFPAPASGVNVSLVSANSGVATVTSSVFISAGGSSATATVAGVELGTTTITASAFSFTNATATINVTTPPLALFLSLSPSPLFFPLGATGILTVLLSSAAPAGGVTVSLVSENTGVATVISSVFIAAGGTFATATVTGVAQGTTTITASEPTFGSSSAAVTVTAPPASALILLPDSMSLPQGSSGNLTVGLPFPAPEGGVNVSLVSENTGVATVTPSVFIAAGGTFATATVTGVAQGTTTITASAPGFTSDTTTVNVTAPLPLPSILLTPSPLNLLKGTTGNLTVSLPSPAPEGGANVSLVSANPGFATVTSPVFIAAGLFSATATVSGVGEGTTTITASAPGFNSGSVVVNVTPALLFLRMVMINGTSTWTGSYAGSYSYTGVKTTKLEKGGKKVLSDRKGDTELAQTSPGSNQKSGNKKEYSTGEVLKPAVGSDKKTSQGAGSQTTGSAIEASTSVNHAPIANYDVYYTSGSDSALKVPAPGVLGNDRDAENNSLTAMLVSGPSGGSLMLSADGSFTYIPNSQFKGSDSFTYKASDGIADSNTAVVTIMVDVVGQQVVAVANQQDNSISLINPETNQVIHTVQAGKKPLAASFFDVFFGASYSVSKLYVALGGGEGGAEKNEDSEIKGAVQVFVGPGITASEDAFDFVASTMIQVGDLPVALALKPDGSQLWVVNQDSDSVTIIDPVADVVLATISLGQKESFGSQETTKQSVSPAAINFSPDGRFAYVVGSDSNRLMVLDTATAVTDLANAILASLEVGEKPVALAVHPTGSVVYVVNRGGGNLSVGDVSVPEIPTLLSQIPVGKTPEGIALLPNGTKLYVTNSESNTVSVLQVQSGPPYLTLLSTIPVGQRPSGIAITKPGSFVDGEYLYVANREDNTVSVIDATNDTVVAVIPVGKGPKRVAAGIIPTAP